MKAILLETMDGIIKIYKMDCILIVSYNMIVMQ